MNEKFDESELAIEADKYIQNFQKMLPKKLVFFTI